MRTTVLAAAALAAAASLSTAGPAFAQTVPCPSPTAYPDCVSPTRTLQTPPAQLSGNAVSGVTTGTSGVGGTRASTGDLPFTGGEIALMGLLGAGAVAGGGALVLAGRRRAGTSS